MRNPKRHSIILLLLLTGMIAVAQPRLRVPEIMVGAQGGVSASTVIFSPNVPNMSPITKACVLGGNGGLVFRYSAQRHCALQVELNYQHRGWRETGEAGIYQRNLHYLEVPFLMHIHFGNNKARGFFNLGPQIGGCLYDDGGRGERQGAHDNQYARIRPFDWGAAAGVGVCFLTRNAGIYQLEVRGDFSLGTLFPTRTTDYFRMANPLDLGVHLAWLWETHTKQHNKIKR